MTTRSTVLHGEGGKPALQATQGIFSQVNRVSREMILYNPLTCSRVAVLQLTQPSTFNHLACVESTSLASL